MRHEDVDRGDVERIAADEQGMERQRHAQPLVAHPHGGMGMHRPVGAKPREGRQHLHQFLQPIHRPPAEVFVPQPISPLAVHEEPVVSRQVARRQPLHLRAHRGGVLPGGEPRSVGKADLVERVERPQVHIRVEVAAAIGPKRPEHLRHRHDRRAEIEAVAAHADRAGPAPRHVQPVDHRDPVSLGAKPHRRRQPAETRPDHERTATPRARECSRQVCVDSRHGDWTIQCVSKF